MGQEWKDAHPDKMREYRRAWYQRNKLEQAALARERNRLNRQKVKQWISEYRKTLKCSWCPENRPAALDFHHLDPTTKEKSVSQLLRLTTNIERIQAEISKCIVVCSNCHRVHHYSEK